MELKKSLLSSLLSSPKLNPNPDTIYVFVYLMKFVYLLGLALNSYWGKVSAVAR
jgi:hypothetical protein